MGLATDLVKAAHRSGVQVAESLDTLLANTPATASFVVAIEAANVINVQVQLQDADGTDLLASAAVLCYLATTAAGDVVATAPSVGTSIGTDGTILVEHTAELIMEVVSEATGLFDLDIEEAATPTVFLIVKMPNGKLVASPAITWA